MNEQDFIKLQSDVASLNSNAEKLENKIDRLLIHFESDSRIGHTGIAEQVKKNAKDIDSLKIDKKILLAIGSVVGGLITGAFWLGSKIKNFL